MCVSQRGYNSGLGSSCQAVAFWNITLSPGIGNILSICFFRKTCYGLCPIVSSIQSNRCVGCFSICKESYGNALWTSSILIVSVSPDLSYSCTGLSRGVAVCNIITIVSCCVFRYWILAYGVNDFLAICIFRKIGKAVSPVSELICFYNLACSLCSVRKKIYRNTARTFTVLVIGIVPVLSSADGGCFWFMSIGNIVIFYLSLIICDCFLFYGVLNLFSGFVFRKIGKAVNPVSGLICCYHPCGCNFAICKKVDCDALRTFSILIVVIVPGLGSINSDLLRNVCVSQSCYGSFPAIACKLIAFRNIHFCPGIFNCFSICFFRKIRYRLYPIVLCIQSHCCSGFFSVCKKGCCNALRTLSVLVVCIVPNLGYRCTGLSWGVTVGDVILIVSSCILRYCFLTYGVNDFLATFIFRQIGKTIAPVSVCICTYGLAVFFYSVCKKNHVNAFRTLSILVVGIVPGLGSCDLGSFRLMSIDDVDSIKLCRIALNCILSYSVYNFFSFCIFRKTSKAVSPVSVYICTYVLAVFFYSVCKKVYGDAGRAFAVLIVVVVPGLSSGNGGKLWSMCVSQRGYSSIFICLGQLIIFRNIYFCPGISDVISIRLFCKICYSLCPVIGSIQSNRCVSCFSVCKESYCDALRTFSILIVRIAPDLGYSCTGLSRGVAVGNIILIVSGCVLRYRILAYGVLDFLAVCIFRQIGEAVGPVILSSYGLGICDAAICKKVNCDLLRALSVLIVRIFPGLGSADINSFQFILYKQNSILGNSCCFFCINCSICFQNKCSITCQQVSSRSYCLAKSIFLTSLKSGYFMGFLGGIPLFYNISILVKNLDVSSFQLFSVSNVYFTYLYLGSGVFYQKCSSITDGGVGVLFIHSSIRFQDKACVACHCISFRSYCLAKGIFLTSLKSGYFMGFLGGIPLFYNISILVKNLDVSSFQLFSVSNVYFAYLYRGNLIGNAKAFSCISGYCGYITGYFARFFYSVNNVFSSFLLVKPGPCVSPVVLRI